MYNLGQFLLILILWSVYIRRSNDYVSNTCISQLVMGAPTNACLSTSVYHRVSCLQWVWIWHALPTCVYTAKWETATCSSLLALCLAWGQLNCQHAGISPRVLLLCIWYVLTFSVCKRIGDIIQRLCTVMHPVLNLHEFLQGLPNTVSLTIAYSIH